MKLEHTGIDAVTGKVFLDPVIISDIGKRESQEGVYRVTNHINYGSKDTDLLAALAATATATVDYSLDPGTGYIYIFDPSVAVTAPSTTGFIDWYRVTDADKRAGYTFELLEGTRLDSETAGSGNLAPVEGPTFSQMLEDPEGAIKRDNATPANYDPAGVNGPFANRGAQDTAFVPLVYNLWKPNNIGQGRYIAAGETVEFVETGDFLLSAAQGQIRGFIDRGILRVV